MEINKPSIPVAHAVHMKESYGNVRHLMKHVQYDKYYWHVCGNLEVLTLLLGLQLVKGKVVPVLN
jgi:hypothetical protein